MSTSINTLVQDLDRRWNEVDTLLDATNRLDYEDDSMIPLCKALTVLMVANLEGYIQEIVKALIADVNDNCYFGKTHYNMKRTFCLQYIPDPKSNASCVDRLIKKFDETDVKYDTEAFLFDRGRNPKLSVVERVYESVGGKNFWGHISDCEVDRVFENDRSYLEDMIVKYRTVIQSNTIVFPYDIDLDKLGINRLPQKLGKESLWSDFINHILTYRHNAAHGSDSAPMSAKEIALAFEKIKILELLSTALIVDAAIVNGEE